MKILKRILKGPHEDLVRSLKILERFSPGVHCIITRMITLMIMRKMTLKKLTIITNIM